MHVDFFVPTQMRKKKNEKEEESTTKSAKYMIQQCD